MLFVFAPLVRLLRSSDTRRVPISEAQHNAGRKSPLESHRRRRTLLILLSSSAFPFPHTPSLSFHIRPSVSDSGEKLNGIIGEREREEEREDGEQTGAECGEAQRGERARGEEGMILDALTRHTSMVALVAGHARDQILSHQTSEAFILELFTE